MPPTRSVIGFPGITKHIPLPAPSGANKKASPRGAPMQHLAPRRNPEGRKGRFNPLDSDPHVNFPRECGAGSTHVVR